MATENPPALAFDPKLVGAIDYPNQLWGARYSPCGKFLIGCGYDALVPRWDVSSEDVKEHKPLSPLAGHGGWVQCLAFHPQLPHVYTADSWGRLSCWAFAEAAPAQPVWTLPAAHASWIRGISVSPDGAWVATCGNDLVVRIWSTVDGKLHKELAGHTIDVYSVCFHPDGKSLVSGDLKGIIQHWDFASGTIVRELDARLLYTVSRLQDCGGVRQLAFDAAGKFLACAGQKAAEGGFATGIPAVLLFDWQTGKVWQEFQQGDPQDGFAYDARFHPEGYVMAASCAMPGKGHLWFWKPGEPKPFYVGPGIANGRSVSLHPDGRRLAVTVSVSQNENGRSAKSADEYPGGSAKIHLLTLYQPQVAAAN